MKTINVSEATNNQLDWLVAKCEGFSYELYEQNRKKWVKGLYRPQYWSPTTDPAQMWPIIEREKINLNFMGEGVWATYDPFEAVCWTAASAVGPTGLSAAARCYVVSKLGETTEVPEEL